MTSETVIETRIWEELAELDDASAVHIARCHGYDVYGEMLGRARWAEMIFLLFRGEAPSSGQGDLLDALAVALANPGPRDPSVHAAMCGGVGGSPAAACLMAALAVGAGQLAGGREVLLVMQCWERCGTDLDAWLRELCSTHDAAASIWPHEEHPPGFDPNGVSTATVVQQALSVFVGFGVGERLPWLQENLTKLEAAADSPLALSGVAAAAYMDLGFTPDEGEVLHLLLRLPGAAVHALEQRTRGHKKFPFFSIELEEVAAGDPQK